MVASVTGPTGEQRSLTPDEIPSTPSAASSTPVRDRYRDLAGLATDDTNDGAFGSEVELKTEEEFERGLFFLSPSRSAAPGVETGDNIRLGKDAVVFHGNDTVGYSGLQIDLSFESAGSQAGDEADDAFDDHDQLLGALGLRSHR